MSPSEQQSHVHYRQQLALARQERQLAQQQVLDEQQRRLAFQQNQQQQLSLEALVADLPSGTQYLRLTFSGGSVQGPLRLAFAPIHVIVVQGQWQSLRFQSKDAQMFFADVGLFYDGQALWLDSSDPQRPGDGALPVYRAATWSNGATLLLNSDTQHRFEGVTATITGLVKP